MVKIAICDDYKEDLDRVYTMVREYCEEKKIQAEIKVFNHSQAEFVQCHESLDSYLW